MKGIAMTRRTDAALAGGILALVLLALAVVAALGRLDEFGAWAWERHHNELSWYIRPLFLLPFCFFAYKRSLTGIVVSLVALGTSMFWFPAPERPSSGAIEFLAMEREYLAGEWTATQLLLGSLVPISLAALALVFWRRSLVLGLVLINATVLTKIAWSFYYGDAAGEWALLYSQILGIVVLNAAVLYFLRRRSRRPTPEAPGHEGQHQAVQGSTANPAQAMERTSPDDVPPAAQDRPAPARRADVR